MKCHTIKVSEDGRYPITLKQGGYWSRIFVCRDENGDRMDLSGLTGVAQVRTDENGDLLLEFVVTVEGGNNDPEKQGEVLVEALAADTLTVPSSGIWDCRLIGNDEPIEVVALSDVELERLVSKNA